MANIISTADGSIHGRECAAAHLDGKGRPLNLAVHGGIEELTSGIQHAAPSGRVAPSDAV